MWKYTQNYCTSKKYFLRVTRQRYQWHSQWKRKFPEQLPLCRWRPLFSLKQKNCSYSFPRLYDKTRRMTRFVHPKSTCISFENVHCNRYLVWHSIKRNTVNSFSLLSFSALLAVVVSFLDYFNQITVSALSLQWNSFVSDRIDFLLNLSVTLEFST